MEIDEREEIHLTTALAKVRSASLLLLIACLRISTVKRWISRSAPEKRSDRSEMQTEKEGVPVICRFSCRFSCRICVLIARL